MTLAGNKVNQYQYQPLYKPNQLICGTGQTAIVTGWTVKQAIAKRLQPSEYAVIGQLYSPTRGISFLIRNLLYNPHVRFLVALNATKQDSNAGGCQCLLDFFRNGFVEGKSNTGQLCWIINSEITGYIDIEIEASALEHLRQSIEYCLVTNISEAVALVQSFSHRKAVASWGNYKEFPMPKVVPTVRPGQLYGHRIEGKTIAETWVKIIHRIKTTGTIRPTGYDGQWQELIDLMAIVTDEPENFYFPEPNYLPCDRAFTNEYISQIFDDKPTIEGVKYTYAHRLHSSFGYDQIGQVIQKLANDIDSARAVMSLWDVRDHEINEGVPCLNHIWVRVVNNELSLTATFRSNDMFSAWPANAIGLRALQKHILDRIVKQSSHKLKMGALITVSQSAHIYDDCWENADNLIQTQYAKICQQRDYADSSGSFTISVQNGSIIVEHITPGSGEVINCYSGKTAQQLYKQIAADCPVLQVDHAIYLGTELQKAEFSLSSSTLNYIQDQTL